MVAIPCDVEQFCSAHYEDEDEDELQDEEGSLGIRTAEYTLKVHSPKTVVTPDEQYTTYGIFLQTSHTAFRLQRSRTRRRFSEFVWLRKELDKMDSWRSPPPLPMRRFWDLLDPKLVESRRRRLEQWIHEVLTEPEYLSSMALHLTLQTELPLQDIQAYLDGHLSESQVEEVWNNQGKLYHYQAHNLLHNSFRQDPMEIHCTQEDLRLTPPSVYTPTLSPSLPPREGSPPPHPLTPSSMTTSEDDQADHEATVDPSSQPGSAPRSDDPSPADDVHSVEPFSLQATDESPVGQLFGELVLNADSVKFSTSPGGAVVGCGGDSSGVQ